MGTQFVSNLDWYRSGPYASYVEARRIVSGCRPVELMKVAQPAGDFSDPAMSDFVLCLIHGGPFKPLIDYGNGLRRCVQRDGDIEVIPARVANTIIYEQPHRFTSLVFSSARIAEFFDRSQAHVQPEFGRLHDKPFRDPLIKRLVLSLWDEAADDTAQGRLFVESAMLTLVARLASLAGRAPKPAPTPGFTPAALTRVKERLLAALDDPPGPAVLAAEAGMAESQFLRAFKAATGLPPHQWLMTRRIERACELLAATQDALADIAYACGFASQSHMTDVFRAKLGVTPGRYRKERRS
jgi:AraC family transcriptional regulator